MPLSSRSDLSSSAIELHGSWLPLLLFPGLTEVEDDTCDGALAIRFIKGRDFAVTRSSPESCWDRFAIVSEHTVELKWLMLNKHNKWFQSSRVKFLLVRMSASWFLVSMYLIWIFGSRLIRSNNQSSATVWVLETCLIVGLPSFNDHLDHCFVVLKHIQQSFLVRRLDVWRNTINIIQHIDLALRFFDFFQCQQVAPVLSEVWVVFPDTETIRSHKSRAGIPSNLNPASQRDDFGFCWTVWNWSLFLTHPTYGNKCMTSEYAQCSSRSDFESSRSHRKNLSLETTVPVCNVWQYYPHSNIVCIHIYDECKKSIDSSVCHRLWSIS